MTIQPLLLTALPPRPGIVPVFGVYGPGSVAAGCTSCDHRTGGGEAAGAASRRLDRRDVVEISREAEARLLGQLSAEAQREVEHLKARDREVRAHEQAHLSAAGPYARGGANFQYATGPDGGRYAVGGEVSIDSSPVPDDPEATVHKAQVVRAAALAPAEPSAQDRRMAAAASKMEAEARQELYRQEQIEGEEATDPGDRDPAEPVAAAGGSGGSDVDRFLGTLFDTVA